MREESLDLRFGSSAGDAWARQFIENLRRERTASLPAPGSLLEDIARAAQEIFREGEALPADPRERTVRAICSLILAAHRRLAAAVGDPRLAQAVVARACLATRGKQIRRLMRAVLWLPADPVWILSRLSLTRSVQSSYGKSMDVAQEVAEERTSLIVRQCPFHRFFVERGESQLTKIVCGWDHNWMDVINGSNRPIRVGRPSALSMGGDCCRFDFVRVRSGQTGSGIDVVAA